jgi:biotin carboxylase
MKPAVVSLAAGASQLPLLSAARALGHAVVGVDRDPEPAGAELCDALVQASTHDADEVQRALAGLPAELKPIAVVTKSSGPPVVTTARVARALGLRGLDPDLAERALTKPGTLQIAHEAGVAVPRYATVADTAALEALDIPTPLVCKPALTAIGKRGVGIARSPDELLRCFEEARASSPDGVVQVESWHPGRDVVVFALFHDGRVSPQALFDEDTDFDSGGRARGGGFVLPTSCADFDAAAVRSAAARFLTIRDLGTGSAYLTFRVADGLEPVLIEVHFDLGGDAVADRLLTEVRPMRATVELLAGGELPEPGPALRPVALRFLRREHLARNREALLAALANMRHVTEVVADAPPSNAPGEQRVGCILLAADDPHKLLTAVAHVDALLVSAAPRELEE